MEEILRALAEGKILNKEEISTRGGQIPAQIFRRLADYGLVDPSPFLSLAELNMIAAEFGIEAHRDPFNSAHAIIQMVGRKNLASQSSIIALADMCEERGSRWCEAIRFKIGRAHV